MDVRKFRMCCKTAPPEVAKRRGIADDSSDIADGEDPNFSRRSQGGFQKRLPDARLPRRPLTPLLLPDVPASSRRRTSGGSGDSRIESALSVHAIDIAVRRDQRKASLETRLRPDCLCT